MENIRDDFKCIVTILKDLKRKEVVLSFSFVSLITALEYFFSLEAKLSEQFFGTEMHPFFLFLFYGAVYYITSIIIGEKQILRSKPFWLISLLSLLILSLNATLYVPVKVVRHIHYPDEARQFLDSCLIHVSYTAHFLIIVPLLYVTLRKDTPQIGWVFRGFHWQFYALLLLFMLPLIWCSSLTDGFTNYYPTCKPGLSHEVLGVSNWVLIVGYQVVYALDFLGTEVLFRGILVVLLSKYLGKRAILPMVTLYTVWHFGKPLGETVSSFFGGYILGYLAYKQKNIVGGILLHIGVAYAMELFAYLQ